MKVMAQMATARNIAKRSTWMWWVFALGPELVFLLLCETRSKRRWVTISRSGQYLQYSSYTSTDQQTKKHKNTFMHIYIYIHIHIHIDCVDICWFSLVSTDLCSYLPKLLMCFDCRYICWQSLVFGSICWRLLVSSVCIAWQNKNGGLCSAPFS